MLWEPGNKTYHPQYNDSLIFCVGIANTTYHLQ